MAKYERRLTGNFNQVLGICERAVMKSASASFEDGSDYTSGGLRVAVRVYERYSMFGGNRVSLNLTLIGDGDALFLSAITSGGSQAVFFKINTLGESSFLRQAENIVEEYKRSLEG